ncbi:hypothetical protein [Lapidilactobacillus luobeiensis]|uniref:hypothetical protein n=1 Tax=Lapidilactobacillus luobeiensis TaxID=2950371 RepID=UPI0021C408E0|nr:hypothetical protein [Lapidilactobacillus luobeiensis]
MKEVTANDCKTVLFTSLKLISRVVGVYDHVVSEAKVHPNRVKASNETDHDFAARMGDWR